MLNQLNISNYAITDQVEFNFDGGMTVITGETGAGKSIALGALGLALGDRADRKAVGKRADRAEIHAGFSIGENAAARAWLEERDLLHSNELILRRTIYADGKSRAYINGKPATLQEMKTLGGQLVDIHGQHDHQSLLRRDTQRLLLDEYAGILELSRQVDIGARKIKRLQKQLVDLQNQDQEQTARVQLLSYQIEELEQAGVTGDELGELEQQQKTLTHATGSLTTIDQVLQLCSGSEQGAHQTLHRMTLLLDRLSQLDRPLTDTRQLLDSARIQVEEAEQNLTKLAAIIDVNPVRLDEIERRLSSIYQLARKHRVKASELPQLLESLQVELDSLCLDEDKLSAMEDQLQQRQTELNRMADQLSETRQKAASELSTEVNHLFKQLRMQNCHFDINLEPLREICSHGQEAIEFKVSTNPGQKPQAMHTIASGGELSRIGLAIQVASSDTSGTPTLVFDEVDAGIGGGVAEIVGNLLHKLGSTRQVVCITHLAQVACKGDHHFVITKNARKCGTLSKVDCLSEKAKVDEIARMLGGIAITDQTRAHAREMLTMQH